MTRPRRGGAAGAALLGLLLLAGCRTLPPTAPPTPGPQPGPPPPVEAAPEPLPTPEPEPAPDATAAISAVRRVAADDLGAATEAVTLEHVHHVVWRDGCLGVALPDRMCTQALVPGFQVLVSAEGQRLAFHTDEAGRQLVQIPGPVPSSGGAGAIWYGGGGCQAAILDPDRGVLSGSCFSEPVAADFAAPSDAWQLRRTAGLYQPFYLEREDGSAVYLAGLGVEPVGAEAGRRLLEWVRTAAADALTVDDAGDERVVLAWHREGGIAGFCDDLTVSVGGAVRATTCARVPPEPRGEAELSEGEHARLEAWREQWSSFTMLIEDPAVADAMTTSLLFSGEGEEAPPRPVRQEILDWAQELFNRAARPGPAD